MTLVRKGLIRGFRILLIPVIGGIAGLVLLALAFLLPAGPIAEHVGASVSTLYNEGVYFSVTPKLAGTQLDNYTEALYLNQALISTQDANLVDCVLSGYQRTSLSYTGDGNTVQNLADVTENAEDTVLDEENKRFFNGYTAAVKFLLLFTHYSGIRQINLYASLFLLLILLALMIRRGMKHYTLPVIVSLLLIHPVSMALNMASFGFYACMMIPCICMLLMKKETLEQKAWLLFGITGAATYYFNMNFIQLLSFGIPILFYFLITGIPEKTLKMIGKTAGLFFAWMTGLVGMMVFKWAVYAVVKDPGVFREMLDQFFFRAGESEGGRIDAIMRNVSVAFENKWWNLLELVFIVYTVIRMIRNKTRLSVSLPEIVLPAMMILLPAARYFILSNHVLVHTWTTYRLLMIPVLAVNLMLTRKSTGE